MNGHKIELKENSELHIEIFGKEENNADTNRFTRIELELLKAYGNHTTHPRRRHDDKGKRFYIREHSTHAHLALALEVFNGFMLKPVK